MLRSWPLHEQRAFFENDLGIPLALEAGIGQAVSAVESRQGHSRWPRRHSRASAACACSSAPASRRFSRSPTGVHAADLRWRASQRRTRGSGDRRALGARDRQRRHRAARGRDLGHRMVDTYPALTPLLRHRVTSRCRASRWTCGCAARPARARSKPRRVPVHASRLQRPSVLDISHVGDAPPSLCHLRHLRPWQLSRICVICGPGQCVGVICVGRAQWSALDSAAWNREFDAPSALISTLLASHVPARLGEQPDD